MYRTIISFALLSLVFCISGISSSADRSVRLENSISAAAQSSACLVVEPQGRVFVAPGQPAVGSQAAATPDSQGVRTATPTAGIVNALCDVTLDIVGCEFGARDASITCDTNGDGIPDFVIQLTNVHPVNANLVQATIPVLAPALPGTGFPLACCGGLVTLTLQLHVSAGDNNIFGDFTLTQTCTIDIGQRAPVVISASPASGFCNTPQDMLISGVCFLLPNGNVNVTSVFAVDKSNPANVITASRFAILTPNLIDALFNFGSSSSSGGTFLIFVSGPSGTSRNLITLPEGDQGCPIGNEQGIQVSFTCTPTTAPPTPTASDKAHITGGSIDRLAGGGMVLTITGSNIQPDAQVTINGQPVKKIKYKNLDAASNTYGTLQLKGVCGMLPGKVVIINPSADPSDTYQVGDSCP